MEDTFKANLIDTPGSDNIFCWEPAKHRLVERTHYEANYTLSIGKDLTSESDTLLPDFFHGVQRTESETNLEQLFASRYDDDAIRSSDDDDDYREPQMEEENSREVHEEEDEHLLQKFRDFSNSPNDLNPSILVQSPHRPDLLLNRAWEAVCEDRATMEKLRQLIPERTVVRDGQKWIDVSFLLMYSQRYASAVLDVPNSTFSKKWRVASNNQAWPFRTVRKFDRLIGAFEKKMPFVNSAKREQWKNTYENLVSEREMQTRPVYLPI
eukprot:TRINITY_DN19931_c0_g1_i1.p1 TRINITY_DN19931_c0_g1~~TRINITY_DN19931_c0_g1_i1.p1  ORF type:complete len:288 (+),score=20.50 TRINITY_DN19931_c0_g1_i1:65-865(+)